MPDAHLNISLKPVDDSNPVPVKLIGGGTTSSGAGGSGAIIGVDTAGTKWLLIADTSKTPATITYIKVSDGTTGTPVGGFTPDDDQNGLTDASLGTDGPAPPTIAGTGIRGWLRGIYEKLSGTLTVTDNSQADVAAGTAPAKASVSGAVYNATAPTLTDGQAVATQVDSKGNLLTVLKAALPAGTNRVGTVGLNDGTNSVAVKAASTAAAAADPALVVALSPNNPVAVNNNVLQSGNNSSTAQLAAGATFTGTWDTGNALLAESVQVMVTSDQTGTLYIDQSQDTAGSVGVQTTSYKVTAGTAFNTNAAIVGKALRVRFTNAGAAATSTLAISTIFTPVMSVLPTTLTQKGNLRIANQESVGATLTQTVVAVPANTATQLVAANANRQYLAIQVIGTAGVNLGFGSAPTVGNGWAIAPASAVGSQGGAVTWDAGVITQQQIQAISSAATTVVVLEGV